MAEQLLIVISGAPGTGKTVLAQRVSEKFQIPAISKDLIKESLFDSLGWSDREQSMKLGIASIELMFLIAGQILKAGYNLIMENNFHRDYDPRRFAKLLDKYPAKVIHIHCKAEPEEIIRRYRNRIETGERHPGHVDDTRIEGVTEGLAEGIWEPVDIGGELLTLDTTEFGKVNYNAIYEVIGKEVAEPDVNSG